MSFSILTIPPPKTIQEQITETLAVGTSNNVLVLSNDLQTIGYRSITDSLTKYYGNMYLNNNTTTEVPASANTWTDLVTPTFVPNTVMTGFTMATNGVLTYTGVETKIITIVANVSAFIGGGTENYRFALTKNGSRIPSAESLTTLKNENGGTRDVSLNCVISVSTNDTIGIQIFGVDTTSALTVKYLSLTASTF
jgi:hypothetical protein